MSGEPRRLRLATERTHFRKARARLSDDVAARVRVVVNGLRTAPMLPGDGDVADTVPPCFTAWRRAVPGTDLWLVYGLADEVVVLWGLKSLVQPLV